MAHESPIEHVLSRQAIDEHSTVPKHRQVYAALRDLILNGSMPANSALPASRRLALELGTSRNTVLAAYDLLIAEGFAFSHGGAGTFVAAQAARPRPSNGESAPTEARPLSALADELRVWRAPSGTNPARAFRPSSPASDLFPYHAWSRIATRALRDTGAYMTDGDPAGYLPLRKAIAQHLGTLRSCQCTPEQIIVTTGSQLGHALCAMLLIGDYDAVWCEDPGYAESRLPYRAFARRLIPVPVDEHGIDIQAGKALSPRPRLISVTPEHQWPLGSRMPAQRRLELLDLAAACGAWIVEDDYDGDLHFDGRSYAALQGLDKTQCVIHLGSFSKSMFPGLRLGYLVVPNDLVDAFTAGRSMLDRFPNTVAQMAMAEFMEIGGYAKHVRRMQQAYAERHALLRARAESKLAGLLAVKPAVAGTFSVAELADGIDDVALARKLANHGVESLALSAAYIGFNRKSGLILGHAIATPEAIRAGVDAISHALS